MLTMLAPPLLLLLRTSDALPVQQRAEARAAVGSDDLAAASIESLPGDSAQAPSSASSAARQPQREGDESSSQGVHSITAFGSGFGSGGSSVSSGTLGPRTPALAPLGALSTLSPADAVAPMRDFASEVASEVRSLACCAGMPASLPACQPATHRCALPAGMLWITLLPAPAAAGLTNCSCRLAACRWRLSWRSSAASGTRCR